MIIDIALVVYIVIRALDDGVGVGVDVDIDIDDVVGGDNNDDLGVRVSARRESCCCC